MIAGVSLLVTGVLATLANSVRGRDRWQDQWVTNQRTALLLRPSETQWVALPKTLAPSVLYWALLLGFGGLLAAEFIKWLGGDSRTASTTWAASVQASVFLPDAAFTMLFLILIPLLFSPGTGIWVAFLAVQFENSIAAGMGLESHWWYWPGTVLLGGAALVELSMGLRQFNALRALRKALEQEVPETLPLSEEQAKWAREKATGGRWGTPILAGVALVAYLLFAWLLHRSIANGPGPEPEPFNPFLLAIALAAALGAVVLPCRIAWSMYRTTSIGSVLWILPTVDGGPLSVAGKDWLDTGALSEDEQKRGDCSCGQHSKLVELELGSDYSDEASVDLHCPVHGVDVVNAMGTAEFAAAARTKPWVWNELSSLPITAMGRQIGVLGYAGRGLPGRAGLVAGKEFVAIEGWRSEPEESYFGGHKVEALRQSGSEPETMPNRVPMAGRIDELDLRPFGIDGHAWRYKHGHPIFVSADQRGNGPGPDSGQI
ncbi:hypothetical protein [Paeniglutamicibacter sp. NPDC091659]|uniref:hypothetical protein n=1 Tax=Paeniglutamicibacter sp. NPDC091659 TaxID=3364389 RepID=UPI00380ED986